MNNNIHELNWYPAELDRIVAANRMPDEHATALLSSAVLFATGQCDLANFADAVAHTRLAIPEDCQDATAQLAGWLDSINELIAASVKDAAQV